MLTLHMGVIDQAYSGEDGAKTTGDVAQILEDKYHVMRVFYELYEEQIADIIARKLVAVMDNPPTGRTMIVFDEIGALFRKFLDADEMSKLLPPTQQIAAAVAGVNHRKKSPNAKANSSRPAFVDTGLYSISFIAWIG